MSQHSVIRAGDLMVQGNSSIDPRRFSSEVFDLLSIPAFDAGEPEVTSGSNIGSSKQLVQPNDILISKIVPHIRRAWVVSANRGRRQIASGEWIVFRSEKVFPGYLRHALVSDGFHSQFMQTVSGVGGSLLRARPSHVGKIEIPLPPLPEQRRIAEVLDRAETLRAQRRQALAQLDALAESIFLDMFGDPVSNPMRWLQVELGEVGDVQGGLQLSASRSSLPLKVPYLRVANVHRDRLHLAEIKTFHATAAELARTTLHVDDILIVEGHGNASEIGRCALWDGSIPECSHQNHLIRLRTHAGVAIPVYVARFLNSAGGRQGLLSASNTTSGLNTISVSKVRSCRALLPPVHLQQLFASRLDAVAKLKVDHEKAAAHLDALFASLQHRAFRSEL